MGRIISTEIPGTMRNRLLKLAYLTSNKLIKQEGLSNESKDLTAFIVILFTKISDLVDQTAKAWEDRNYWLKSDLFQKQWAWVSARREELENALFKNDWPSILAVASSVISNTNISLKESRFFRTEPWKGAYLELQVSQPKNVRL
jgi:hypothetical protein